jgi:hypothetical protein
MSIDAEGVKPLRDLGIHRVVMPPPAYDPDGLAKGCEEFASRVIAKV